MIFLSQILRDLQAMLVAHFWPTWVTLTAAAAICRVRSAQVRASNQRHMRFAGPWRCELRAETDDDERSETAGARDRSRS